LQTPLSELDKQITELFTEAQRKLFSESADEVLCSLRSSGTRQVCQYQFKKNDIVWICRSCQRDETCVLCNDCFPRSCHDGHEVFFYHSQAGGCCDCGDPGAWDINGFCDRHGKTKENPLEDLPMSILTSGKDVVESVVSYIQIFCCEQAIFFDVSRFLEDSSSDDSCRYSLALYVDDIHTTIEINALLFSCLGMTQLLRDSAILKLRTEGFAVVFEGERSEVHRILRSIRERPEGRTLSLCIKPTRGVSRPAHPFEFIVGDERSEEVFLIFVAWMTRLASMTDGLCRLICSSFTVERLCEIMTVDCRLKVSQARALHGLFLTLMADISFKHQVAAAYAKALPVFASLYGDGCGSSDSSVFRLSVQFLNRAVFVDEIVKHHNFLESLANSMKMMLFKAKEVSKSKGTPVLKHPTLKFRRYDCIIGDLKIIFILPGLSKLFCEICDNTFLETLSMFQYMDTQVC
jgi:hypothetical protein